MSAKRKGWLKYGVATNDILLKSVKQEDKESYKKIQCKWHCMLKRCYSGHYPSYEGSYVCDEWLLYSNFQSWVLSHKYWEYLDLDKDLVLKGNKVYSPTTCSLVPPYINKAFIKQTSELFGVTKDSSRKTVKWVAQCRVFGIQEYFGRFSSPELAHKKWQEVKIENLKSLLDRYSTEDCFDFRVGQRLIETIEAMKQDIIYGRITKSI